MLKFTVWLRNNSRHEAGQDLVEYAMLFALIALIVIVAVTFFGDEMSQAIARIGTIIQGCAAAG